MNEIPKLETIDAEELISTPLEKVKPTIDKILGQGLYLLVGDSKIGKSWLILWFCLKVALGETVWDYPVRQGTVLYLCLEDNHRRMQNRLFHITEIAPNNLHFACMAQDLESGLFEQIEQFLGTYPYTTFIAVDTLQMVRGGASSNSSAYASDYKDLTTLKNLADKHHITILLVHHTSKRLYEKNDPFKQISGTTALMGASDGCIMMIKESVHTKTATLYISGRDVEQRQLVIENKENIWYLLEDNAGEELQQKLISPVIPVICNYVLKVGNWSGTATELVSVIQPLMKEEISAQTITGKINSHLEFLHNCGIDYRTKRTANQRMIYLSTLSTKDEESRVTETTTSHL